MSEPFYAEIRVFPYNFAPRGWAFCNGQVLPITQNTALFSLLGTTYGGNGQTTFGLPDLRGRAAMHPGQGPGLTNRTLGEMSGQENVTLLSTEMPIHTHTLQAMAVTATAMSPAGALLAEPAANPRFTTLYAAAGTAAAMDPALVGLAGSGQPHNNMQPYLTLNFCISLQGIFPPRS